MYRYILYLLTIFPLLLLFACQKTKQQVTETNIKSYINNFELVQENSENNTSIIIKSPHAIIDTINNDIDIFDSSIKIVNSNDQDIKVESGRSSLNNYKSLIRFYNNVNISLLSTNNSFINTDSFEWELKSSTINFDNPLIINFKHTTINSSNGSYDIDSGQLNLNNNIFNRNIFDIDGELIYQIKILADRAKFLKDNKSLEFNSERKQVETTIKFLSIK